MPTTDVRAALDAHDLEDAEAAQALADAHTQATAAQERADELLAQGIVDRADAAKLVAQLRDQVAALQARLPRTRFGMNLSPGTSWTKTSKETATTQAARLAATFGKLPAIKYFYSGQLPTRFMPANEGQAPVAYVCSKYNQVELAAGKHDAQISAYLDTVPAGQQVRLVNWQEPDDEMWKAPVQFTAAQHRAATDHLCDLVHAHVAGKDGRAQVWECYMGYSLDVGRFDDAAVSRKVDGIGWDYYWNSAKAGAQDPAVTLKRQADKTQALGIGAWALLETGDNPGTFADGKLRAAFWSRVWDAAVRYAYDHALYFNAVGTTGDHRLIPGTAYSDPSIDVLKDRIAS